MICSDCAEAADQQAGPEAHCNAQPGPESACDCQHRTDRYRCPPSTAGSSTVIVEIHPDPSQLLSALRDVRRNGLGRR